MQTYADVAHGANWKPRFVAKWQQNVSEFKCARQSVRPITSSHHAFHGIFTGWMCKIKLNKCQMFCIVCQFKQNTQ